jgi:hypothetical protein
MALSGVFTDSFPARFSCYVWGEGGGYKEYIAGAMQIASLGVPLLNVSFDL